VGQRGAAALAAAGVGSMVYMVVVLTFESLGTGTQIIVSRRWGEKNRGAASGALLNSLILTIPVGLLLTSLALYETLPFIDFLVKDPEVRGLTTNYVRIRFLCLCFFMVVSSFLGYFDGVGKTMLRMGYMIIVVSLNVVLNYLLIFGKFGFPRLGVSGAALATSISVAIGSFYVLFRVLKDDTLRHHPFFCKAHIHLEIIKKIVLFALPKGGRMFFTFTSFLLFIKIIGMVGVKDLAASNILLAILSFSLMPGWGIGIAGATLVGQSLGGQKYLAARHYGWASVRFGVLFMGLSGACFIIFARPILALFTPDQAVINVGFVPLIILGSVQVFDAIGIILAACLDGAGATHWVMKADIVIHWILLLPLAYLLAVVLNWGSAGAWASIGVGMILYAMVMVRKFRGDSWLNIAA
ncbi:MAG TPA: MATE family efflux transporter, partial [Proteobacteria bacterium]|nr:MATE family efflux transporter [Pseudomonadota bacterium]